jgi:hypothetical protein
MLRLFKLQLTHSPTSPAKQTGDTTLLDALVSSGAASSSKFNLYLSQHGTCSSLSIGGAPNPLLVSGAGVRIPAIAGASKVRFCLFLFASFLSSDLLLRLPHA